MPCRGQMTDYYAPLVTFASIKNFCYTDGKAENLGHPICFWEEEMTNDKGVSHPVVKNDFHLDTRALFFASVRNKKPQISTNWLPFDQLFFATLSFWYSFNMQMFDVKDQPILLPNVISIFQYVDLQHFSRVYQVCLN